MILSKIGSYIVDPWKIVRKLVELRKLDWVPDVTYLKLVYRANMYKKLELKNPKTFNEKLQWLKLYDRNPMYTTMVDKYEAKKYVANIIGEEYIIKTLGVWERFEDINFDALPDQFVLKTTHDSGSVVICKNKLLFNKANAQRVLERSLKTNFYFYGREWPYKNVKPRIIAEEFMVDESGKELKDYKIMCFNGVPKCSFVCSNRSSTGLCVNFYDLDWNELPFERHYPRNKNNIDRPTKYNTMLELAQRLSKGLVFARIDFYEIYGRIYFGEITFYPGNGMEEFTPEEWDYKLGRWIKLPEGMLD